MFAPASNILQAENTDLSSGMTLVAVYVENVHNLQAEEKFCDTGIWDKVVTQIDAHSRRARRENTLLQVVEETTGNNEMNKDKMRRLFYSILNQVINEIDMSFSHQNAKL